MITRSKLSSVKSINLIGSLETRTKKFKICSMIKEIKRSPKKKDNLLSEQKSILSRTNLMLNQTKLLKKAKNKTEESTLLPMLFKEIARHTTKG